jgi:hypothetical protein
MRRFSRRDFIKLGASLAASLTLGKKVVARGKDEVLSGKLKLKEFGADFLQKRGRSAGLFPQHVGRV